MIRISSKRILALIIFVFLAGFAAAHGRQKAPAKDTVFNAGAVMEIMKQVGDWQLQSWQTTGFKHKKTEWTNAALYTGLFDLSKVSGDEKYDQALINIGSSVGWSTGPNRLMADDYCVGQTYSLLYMKYKQRSGI